MRVFGRMMRGIRGMMCIFTVLGQPEGKHVSLNRSFLVIALSRPQTVVQKGGQQNAYTSRYACGGQVLSRRNPKEDEIGRGDFSTDNKEKEQTRELYPPADSKEQRGQQRK